VCVCVCVCVRVSVCVCECECECVCLIWSVRLLGLGCKENEEHEVLRRSISSTDYRQSVQLFAQHCELLKQRQKTQL